MPARRPKQWVRGPYRPDDAEKRVLRSRCDALLAEVIVPRFLPEVSPSDRWNYPIALGGQPRGAGYRFFEVWQTPTGVAPVETFTRGFARISLTGRDQCDVSYFRHIDVWHTIYLGISLDAALAAIVDNPLLHPTEGF